MAFRQRASAVVLVDNVQVACSRITLLTQPGFYAFHAVMAPEQSLPSIDSRVQFILNDTLVFSSLITVLSRREVIAMLPVVPFKINLFDDGFNSVLTELEEALNMRIRPLDEDIPLDSFVFDGTAGDALHQLTELYSAWFTDGRVWHISADGDIIITSPAAGSAAGVSFSEGTSALRIDAEEITAFPIPLKLFERIDTPQGEKIVGSLLYDIQPVNSRMKIGLSE